MPRLGELLVGVDCTNCGVTAGKPLGETGNRCGDCGRFAESYTDYCPTHEIDHGKLSGYDHCPRCREEERIQRQQQEMHERRADPNMHPTIDAPRR